MDVSVAVALARSAEARDVPDAVWELQVRPCALATCAARALGAVLTLPPTGWAARRSW